MKKIKRLISCMLALVMVLALGMTVSAAGGTYTITINNEERRDIERILCRCKDSGRCSGSACP